NNAYVHRAFSFENALLDAVMLLREKEAAHVLVGAIDEIVNPSFTILNRFGIYKPGDVSNLELYKANTKGTIAGEGASFFALTAEPSGNDYAKLEGLHTFYKPGPGRYGETDQRFSAAACRFDAGYRPRDHRS
ncbi:MAG TPA: hypothetical protein PLK54_04790, partial [Ferruginibacter sp.]|nr:hypothetical protein [Ferruginibacter sp.]